MTLSRRFTAALAGVGLAVIATTSLAAEMKAFDAASFEKAQAAGRPIIVDIKASWCPTCAAQKPIIASLAASETYSEMVIFEVDFDSQKDVVRSLNARMQSTLIAYNGESETGRSVGDTNADSIATLFESAMAK